MGAIAENRLLIPMLPGIVAQTLRPGGRFGHPSLSLERLGQSPEGTTIGGIGLAGLAQRWALEWVPGSGSGAARQRTWLGAKGSRVQIPPPRPFFTLAIIKLTRFVPSLPRMACEFLLDRSYGPLRAQGKD